MDPKSGPFPEDALEANRAGRLTERQQQGWREAARSRRKRIRSGAIPAVGIGLVLLFASGPESKAALRLTVGTGSLALALGIFAVSLWSGDALSMDAREGRVESIEGAIGKRSRGSVHGGSYSTTTYYLEVGGRTFITAMRTYEAAPDAGIVRLFYLPRSHRVINLERLADRPLPEGPAAVQEMIGKFVGAFRDHDRIGMAEARAASAAFDHRVHEDFDKDAPPPPSVRPRNPRELTESLPGSWRNSLMTVSFAVDGTVTVAALIGPERRGHWSVDAKGRLVSDITGRTVVADAWIEGDRLTISAEGQALSFSRA
jgi:hypothetical protein